MDRRPADPLLREALSRMHEAIEIPDGHAAWEAMEKKLGRRATVRKRTAWIRLAAAAIMLTVLIDSLFLTVKPVQAITGYFLKVKRSSSAVSVLFGNYNMEDRTGALTAPPPEEDFVGRWEEGESIAPPAGPSQGAPTRKSYTLDEARAMSAFELLLPETLPDGFRLKEARPLIVEPEGKAYTVTIHYGNEQGQGIIFRQTLVRGSGKRGSATTVGGKDTIVRELSVRGDPGVVVESGTHTIMQWMTETHSFEIHGTIPRETALAMAESVK